MMLVIIPYIISKVNKNRTDIVRFHQIFNLFFVKNDYGKFCFPCWQDQFRVSAKAFKILPFVKGKDGDLAER